MDQSCARAWTLLDVSLCERGDSAAVVGFLARDDDEADPRRDSYRGKRRAAVALNDATATTPGRRSSRSADAAVISATIGPTRTRVRLPIGATETTAALTWFMRRVIGDVRSERDVPRIDGDADRAVPRVGAPEREPVVEHDIGQAVSGLDHVPGEKGRAGEARHEGVARHGDELGRRAELQDRAVRDDADAVRERRGVLEVVRDEDRRQAEAVEELAELGADARTRVRVERRERLVEEKDRRIARERASERDPLALPARELVDARLREVGDPEALEQRRDVATRRAPNRTLRATSRCGKSAYSWKR